MRRVAFLLGLFLLVGCGSHSARSPAAVARAWSAALDRNDNEAAARLFAPNTQVVQNGELTLQSHDAAVAWNEALPCGGTITKVVARGKHDVLVVFRLKERPSHRCDAPGSAAAAIFRVEHGKIVLWHQTEVPASGPAGPVI